MSGCYGNTWVIDLLKRCPCVMSLLWAFSLCKKLLYYISSWLALWDD
jgi:hypothetical protein